MKKRIDIREAVSGQMLAEAVKFNGSVLLDVGTTLTTDFIARLKKRDIGFLIISSEDELTPEIFTEQCIAPVLETIDDLLKNLERFNPDKESQSSLMALLEKVDQTRDQKSVQTLINMLKKNDHRLDQKTLKTTLIRILGNLPYEPAIGHILLVQLSLSCTEEVKATALQVMTRSADQDLLTPLLLGVKKYPLSLNPEIVSFLKKFKQELLLDICHKIFNQNEHDVNQKILGIMRNVLPEDRIKSFSRIYNIAV